MAYYYYDFTYASCHVYSQYTLHAIWRHEILEICTTNWSEKSAVTCLAQNRTENMYRSFVWLHFLAKGCFLVFYIVHIAPVCLNCLSLRTPDVELPVCHHDCNEWTWMSALNDIFVMTYFLRIYAFRQRQKRAFFV